MIEELVNFKRFMMDYGVKDPGISVELAPNGHVYINLIGFHPKLDVFHKTVDNVPLARKFIIELNDGIQHG